MADEKFLDDNIDKLAGVHPEIRLDARVERLAHSGPLGRRKPVDDDLELVQVELGIRKPRDEHSAPSQAEMSERRREWEAWLHETNSGFDPISFDPQKATAKLMDEFSARYPDKVEQYGWDEVGKAFGYVAGIVNPRFMEGGRADLYEKTAERLEKVGRPRASDRDDDENRTELMPNAVSQPAARTPPPEGKGDMVREMREHQDQMSRRR